MNEWLTCADYSTATRRDDTMLLLVLGLIGAGRLQYEAHLKTISNPKLGPPFPHTSQTL